MAIKPIPQGVGLYTDGSGIDAPAGAMRVADDVLMHRPGLIVPRPGFGDTTGLSASSTPISPASQGWAYRDEVLLVALNTSNSNGAFYRSTDGGFAQLAPPDVRVFDAAEMRGSLYVTGALGVHKLEGLAAEFERAGSFPGRVAPLMWSRLATTGASGRYAVDATSSVAYRYVWARRDANGYIRRSEPSPRVIVTNSSAEAYHVTVSRLYLPSVAGVTQIVAGDVLEWYRTVNSGDETVDPGDECFFAVSHVVTAAEVTAGYVDVGAFWDMTLDSELGAALYTNVSQGGLVANANQVPPLSRCLAAWSDVMWYGHTTEQAVLAIEPRSVFDTSNDEHDLDGVHFSTATGTWGTGSATMTGVSRVNGMKVGQYVTDMGYPVVNDGVEVSEGDRTFFSQGTKITAITTKITITNNAAISGGDDVIFSNLSNVGGPAQISWDTTFQTSVTAVIGADANESATNLADAINAGDKRTWGAGELTATVASNVVSVVSEDGHGLPVTISGSGISVDYWITLSANPKSAGSSDSFDVCDYVEVNGIEYYPTTRAFAASLSHRQDILLAHGLPAWRCFAIDTTRTGSTSNADQVAVLVQGLAEAINVQAIRSSFESFRAYADDKVTIRNRWNSIDEQTLGPSSFALLGGDYATSMSFEAPVRPASFIVSASSGTTAPETVPGRLYWSKPNEPEAVPGLNFVDVGDSAQPILALVPLQDALLVFKRDGIFRVTGNPPSGWVVDELDREKRLLSRQCVDVLDGVAFAWTDRGIVPVTEGAVGEPISAPIADVLREAQRLLPADAGPGRGFWIKAHPRLGLLIVAVASTADEEASGSLVTPDELYVWCRSTGAWQRWDRGDACMVFDPAEGRMLACPPAQGAQANSIPGLYERDEEGAAASYVDASVSVAVTMSDELGPTTAVQVTKTLLPWTPTTCDVVSENGDGDGSFRVTAVTDLGSSWRLTLDGVVGDASASTATIRQGYAPTMQWQAQQMASLGQRWQELHLGLERVESEYLDTVTVNVGGAAHRDASPSTVAVTVTPPSTYSRPLRAGVPRECVRTPHLYPYAKVCGAGQYWELASAYAHHTGTSRRVAR